MELREVENDRSQNKLSSTFAVFLENILFPASADFEPKKQSFLKIDFGAVGAHRSNAKSHEKRSEHRIT